MLNIVISVAGAGSRLRDKYFVPKPLVEVNGKTIIEHCVESLNIPDANYIFVIRQFSEFGELSDEYTDQLFQLLLKLKKKCTIIETQEITSGPACSVLLAKEKIYNDSPCLVINCDQSTEGWGPQSFLIHAKQYDACVTTYPHDNLVIGQKSPYSFVELNEQGFATRFDEKLCISQHVLCGIHWWAHGSDFVKSAEEMIEKNDRVNNEFYISKSFNYLLQLGKKIGIYQMEPDEFYALGDTKEIEYYLSKHSGNI